MNAPMCTRMFASLAPLLIAVFLAGRLAAQEKSDPPNPLREKDAAARLPWEKETAKKPSPRLQPIAGPREFLTRYGIVASQWESFLDGEALSGAEEEVLVRLLYLYSRFGQDNVEAWADRGLALPDLAELPADHRGKIVALRGTVQRASAVKLLPEVATRFEFAQYYQVQLQLGPELDATVYCRVVPAAWKLDAEMDERASAYGLFLKVGDEQGGSPLLLVTDRLAWLPAQPRPELGATPAHVALASLGVDVGRLQAVGKERRTGLTAVDREPFYQVLAALGNDEAAARLKPQSSLDLGALLKEPQQHAGVVLPVRGLARRVVRVDVPDLDIRRRFGIDHYFEVDLSLPLEHTIKLGADPKAKNQAVTYENSFPATICVRELPAGLSVGDDVRQSIESGAVFFKLWLYQSGYTQEAGLAQPAPLFLARSVRVVTQAEQSSFWPDVVVGTAMATVALVFIGIVLWYRASDRAAKSAPPAAGAAKPTFSDMR